MRRVPTIAALAAVLGFTLAAAAPVRSAAPLDGAVREGQAVVTELGADASAVTYWVSQSDGWHVVTTVDTVLGPGGVAEQHAVARFSAVLLPGQAQLISVPVAVGAQQLLLRIRRLGDRIDVVRVPGPPA